jgi:hypothetical protein
MTDFNDPDEFSDLDDEDAFMPFNCECEVEHDEEELASNVCKACGKEIS